MRAARRLVSESKLIAFGGLLDGVPGLVELGTSPHLLASAGQLAIAGRLIVGQSLSGPLVFQRRVRRAGPDLSAKFHLAMGRVEVTFEPIGLDGATGAAAP